MGNRDAHEGDGAREGRHAGGQKAGPENQRRAEAPDIDPHALGVNLAQLIGPDGLGHEEHSQHTDRGHRRHHFYIVPGHAGEAAHGPVVQVHNVRVISKSHHEIRDRRADVADHHAADHQHGHHFHFMGNQKNKAHGNHGTGEGRQNHAAGAHDNPLPEKKYHHERNHQLRPGGNSQHEGAGDGVRKKGLQEEPRDRQRAAENRRRHHPRQTDIPDDAAHSRVLSPARKDL